MALLIENLAKQFATLTPRVQAKIFEHLAVLAGEPGLKELAEKYQRLLDQSDSTLIVDVATSETKAPSKSKLYPSAADKISPQGDRVSENIAVYGSAQGKASEEAKCYQELYAIFDGEVLRPESKIDLDLNARYKVRVEKPISGFPEIKNRAFRRIAARAVHMGIRDFAEQHDHYLYGVPKK
jgi:hypothetical protein